MNLIELVSTDGDRDLEYQVIRDLVKSVENPKNKLEANLASAVREELTERQRQAVLLYYLEQMPMKSVAREMDVCVSTVCRTLYRAKNKLRRCLKYGGRELLSVSKD